MTKKIEQIRIFISSPSDVGFERTVAQKVIEDLNRTLCASNGFTLFPITWEKNIYPSVGDNPQDVINKQIGDYDVFVGIMANRFGTPTHRAGSGTEEEFDIAFDNREYRQIMMFFKDAPIRPSTLDLKQLEKVMDFKKKIANKGIFYKQFSDDFEDVFRDSLTMYLTNKYINSERKVSIDRTDTTIQDILSLDNYFESQNPTYEKYSIINILAIPNSQFILKDIYVAQSLVKENRFDDNCEITIIDKIPVQLIKKYKKILISDTAGMGKSTIMKYMFIDLIDKRIRDVGIPIYIELNRLKKYHNILQAIKNELRFLSKEFRSASIIERIKKGGFVFFMDGYDEISLDNREYVTDNIKKFIRLAGLNNYYIMSSRPEEGLSSFGDFQSFKIQPLTKEEAYELLRKYDVGKAKEVSKKLIELLKSGDYESIDEYLGNPLLISLLYAAFNHKHKIPLKKHLYYSQVYEALYESSDISKGIEPHQKRTDLDIAEFSRVLRCVGYICFEKTRIRFDKETIIKIIRRAKEYCANLSFKESDFLKDILTAVPLFCKDGNEYRWAHKSLMEYFAARFIADDGKEKQDEILKGIFYSASFEKYNNLMELYYDIDNLGFVKNIEYRILIDYVKFYENSFFESSKIKKEWIDERISLLFAQTAVIDSSLTKKMYQRIRDGYNLQSFDLLDELYSAMIFQYEDIIKGKYGIDINEASIKDYVIYIGTYQHPRKDILKFLAKRKEYLFLPLENGVEKFKIKNFNLEILDSRTGQENPNIYRTINSLLKLNYANHAYVFAKYYLDIQKCRDEIAQIDRRIIKNDGTMYTSWLDGL